MWLQVALLLSFSWLGGVPLRVRTASARRCVYGPRLRAAACTDRVCAHCCAHSRRWAFMRFPCLGYYEWCCYEQACVFWIRFIWIFAQK